MVGGARHGYGSDNSTRCGDPTSAEQHNYGCLLSAQDQETSRGKTPCMFIILTFLFNIPKNFRQGLSRGKIPKRWLHYQQVGTTARKTSTMRSMISQRLTTRGPALPTLPGAINVGFDYQASKFAYLSHPGLGRQIGSKLPRQQQTTKSHLTTSEKADIEKMLLVQQ